MRWDLTCLKSSMSTPLKTLDDRLRLRLRRLEAAHERLVSVKGEMRRVDRFALQEGLVSSLWQGWCDACRSIVLSSVKGAVTASGAQVTSPFSARSIDEIRFAAMQYSRRQNVQTQRLHAIAGDHLEPTWGDFSKLERVIRGLQPTNTQQLLSHLGTALSIEELRTTRNACAHISADRLRDVRRLTPRYDDTRFEHPSDVMFWRLPGTGMFSWDVWLGEIRTAFGGAVA